MSPENELTIRGDRVHLECLLERMEVAPRSEWKRDLEIEDRLRLGGGGPGVRCFSSPASAGRPAVVLWLRARGLNEWYVSNIVSLQQRELSDEELDRVLREFQRDCLQPAALGCEVEIEMVWNGPTLERELSREAIQLLKAFSSTANRQSLHSKDRERLNAFLIQVHRDESLVDRHLLDAWLEREGWPQPQRAQLIDELSSARSLLVAYDEELQR